MTDQELLEKKLAFIETCISDLRRLAHPEKIASDLREARFVEHTLQLAIQAALDVASHIVSNDRLGEPTTNRELFSLLAKAGYVNETQSTTLSQMAGFRNVLVHGYDEVDLAIVRDVLENRLGDLLSFAGAIRARFET